MELSPHSLTRRIRIPRIRSLIENGNLADPFSFSALPRGLILRLALKLFRGEPAITEFDWYFTSNHNSSPCFAQHVGSGLPTLLHVVHPGHG